MTRKIRAAAAIALVGATALTLAGCSAGGSDPSEDGGKVTMTFWHNSTTGPGKAYWDSTTQAIQNEDLDGKLQTALNSEGREDLRHAGRRAPRGHLVLEGPVRAGRHRRHPDHDGRAERGHRQAQGEGHRPGGRRREGRLPAAHCSTTRAGPRPASSSRTSTRRSPSTRAFLTTAAQQGAGSSAGLLANHKAAMELMGAWDPGVIASLTPTRSRSATSGGSRSPRWTAARVTEVDDGWCRRQLLLGTGPKKACTDFLNFIVQEGQPGGVLQGLQRDPVNKDAQSVVSEPTCVAAYRRPRSSRTSSTCSPARAARRTSSRPQPGRGKG
ncbi:hypothetical protein Pfo_031627 [Paulownia fortunei]|nr:hypothetical protein Pfo_031627 [Paulownia fortunei]